MPSAKVLSDVPRFIVVGEATDDASCLQRVSDLRPDVLILDVSMPGGGPAVAKAAREINPDMHILVFSGRQDARLQREMLGAGADQYVVKTGRLRPLLEALDRAFTHRQRSARWGWQHNSGIRAVRSGAEHVSKSGGAVADRTAQPYRQVERVPGGKSPSGPRVRPDGA